MAFPAVCRRLARSPQLESQLRRRCRVTVAGIVQGVGFRPFVNRLARVWGLAGTVSNFPGGVTIEIEGSPAAVDGFLAGLRGDAPPIAVIDSIQVEELETVGQTEFVIAPSSETGAGPILVSPDVAICADCVRELHDPSDRRYRHPFINCTNCGPRFTIVRRVPYDRRYTAMAAFPMCPQCEREYHDIDDRRYHAQPVACPRCGPTLTLVCPGYADQSGDDALRAAQRLLAAGGILAVKGLGGFHLACDARNQEAVQTLRERKRREQKPLAVMVADLDTASRLAEVSPEAAELLTSARAPIVLAPKLRPEPLAPGVAPDSPDYGLLLAYTPLHRLLLTDAPYDALVMTSGNLSDEPLCTDNDEARERLESIADAWLLHDRQIVVGCDDSVLRTSPRGPIVIRRARGYVPFPVRLGRQLRTILAVGAHLKNTFCITSGANAFLSPHVGDLEDAATLAYFERCVAHMESILQVTPQALACDLHPDYLATRYARDLARERGLPLIATQHHHAHIAACLADNGCDDPVVGLACDGTGLGDDGTVWGCEVLVCDRASYRRVGHLREIPLPGGDLAVRQPWRAAVAHLWAGGSAADLDWLRARIGSRVGEEEWEGVLAMLERGVNSPLVSSAGRLFDAVAALLDLHLRGAYEGQAAMSLEATAARWQGAEPLAQPEDVLVIDTAALLLLDPRPLLEQVMAQVRTGHDAAHIAASFHRAFSAMLARAAEVVAVREGLSHVALSGGTFQNRILLQQVCELLEARGLRPLIHRSVPPNDGGLALGQAVIADAQLGLQEAC